MRISDWSSDVCSSDLLDIGAQNQEGCVSARVIYVESGTDEDGLERANRLGELTFAALQTLPDHLSTPHKAFDHGLKSEIDAIRLGEDDYKVFGGRANEGAVIVSQEDYPVDFSRNLACRVGNKIGRASCRERVCEYV